MSRIQLPAGIRSYSHNASDDSFENSGMLTVTASADSVATSVAHASNVPACMLKQQVTAKYMDILGDDDDDDDEKDRLPPTLSSEAAPHLRAIFKIINDPKVSGRGKAAEYGVPEHLQGFVSEYLAARGYKIRFSVGQLTKRHYVTVLSVGE